MDHDNLLDKDYIIIENKGKGGTAITFKVKEKKTGSIYAAKVLKDFSSNEKQRIVVEKIFNNEIKILNHRKEKVNNSYITNYIKSGCGEVIRENKPNSTNKYLILEYAHKGCLLDYIILPQSGFKEKYSKLIFSKILKGIKACHEANVYHRDIKLENILLDENFNPKICDFGYSKMNQKKAIEPVGTLKYAAPEVLSNRLYDCSKIDVFSLGVTLLFLVDNSYGFTKAEQSDEFYQLIMKESYKSFWDSLNLNRKGIDLTENFKKLYFKMVSLKPQNRPSIEEILDSDWMKDVKELNEEKIIELENEIKDEFSKREIRVKEKKQKNMESLNNCSSSSLIVNRSGGKNIINYFENNLKPKNIDENKDMNTFIKIKGNLNPVNFMNILIHKIKEKYENNCLIEISKKYLKFTIIFGEEEEEENNEKDEEIEGNEFDINENEDNENKECNENKKDSEENSENINLKKECNIKVKLHKINNDHLIRFIKKSGDLEDFYKNVEIISKLISSIL